MASYDAQINILVGGINKINDLENRLSRIQDTIEEINGMGADGIFGRGTDLGVYNRALREINATANAVRRQTTEQQQANTAVRDQLLLYSRLNREQNLYRRRSAAFTEESRGVRETNARVIELTTQLRSAQRAFSALFADADIQGIRVVNTEIAALLEELREINRMATGTKNVGANTAQLQAQADGWAAQIRALRGRASALQENEEILARLTVAERNLIGLRNGDMTFKEEANVRLGKQELANATSLIKAEENLASMRRRDAADYEKQLNRQSTQIKSIMQLASKALKAAGSATLDAVTFGKGAQVARGARNAAIRGGIGLGALGVGGAYAATQQALGSVDLGPLQGPAVHAASAIGDAINNALGGLPGIIGGVLSALGDVPGALGLASVAALAFAPAMKTAGEAVYLAGKKFGESKFGENIKLTLDRQTNIFESVINKASEMNMALDASKSGLDAVGQAVRSLPALPAAGQTAFKGEVRRGRSGGFIGGGARELLNAEYLSTFREGDYLPNLREISKQTKTLASRSDEAAQATLMFAEKLSDAANDLEVTREAAFRLSQELADAKTAFETFKLASFAESANAYSKAVLNINQAFRDYVAAGGKGLDITTQQSQAYIDAAQSAKEYAKSVNAAANLGYEGIDAPAERLRKIQQAQESMGLQPVQAPSLALRPAGFTNQDVRTKNLLDDLARYEQKLDKIVSDGQLELLQIELSAELDNIERITAAQKAADDARWARETKRLEALPDIADVRRRPISFMTPQERGVLPTEGGGVQLSDVNILDPASLRADRLRRIQILKKRRDARGRALSEGLIGGAFPLLFGQGVGASVGGGLGGAAGALAGGNLGFGMALAGSAIGGEIDKAVIAAGKLNSAFLTAAGSYDEIRKSGIQFTAELENQVNTLKEAGNFTRAAQLEKGAVQSTTGDINAAATEGVAAAGAVLSATWNDTYKSIQTTLGILASPFLFALNALLTPVKALFQGFNAIASFVANLGWSEQIKKSNEEAYKLTEEYQKQIAEIQKQINEAGVFNAIQEEQVAYLQESLGLNQVDTQIMKDRAEAAKRVAENEKEIKKIRRENPGRTDEQRQKVNQLISQQQKKFILEESAIAFTKAQEIYLAIQENNRNISIQKKEYERQYQDFVTDRIKEQADLNLEANRRVQDAKLKALEQEAQAVKEIAEERLRSAELASKERSLSGSLQAAISADPIAGELQNNIKLAIEQWKNGRQAVENDTKNRQKQLQIEIQRGEVQIERYKYDMAIKIARTNEESQKRIARINEEINKQNEEVSRKNYLRQLLAVGLPIEEDISKLQRSKDMALDALSNKLGNLTEADKSYYKDQAELAQKSINQLQPFYTKLQGLLAGTDKTFGNLAVAKLQPMQNIPRLTAPSADVGKAEKELLNQLQTSQSYITSLKEVNGLKEQDLTLSETIINAHRQGIDQVNQTIKSAQTELSVRQETVRLLLTGVNPAIAEQISQLRVAASLEQERLQIAIAALQAYTDPALQSKLAPLIQDLRAILDAMPDKVSVAEVSISKSKAPIPGEKIATFISESEEKLRDLESVAVSVSQSIGDAVGNSLATGITGLIEGTTTAKDIFANFLKDVGQILIQEATRMIAIYVALAIARQFAGLSGSSSTTSSTGPNPGGIPSTGNVTAPNINGVDIGAGLNVGANGAYFSSGLAHFANGGMFSNSIVASPTLFKFADGGSMRAGLMGEAGPEAIMPLQRGPDGKLGVSAKLDGAMTRYGRPQRGMAAGAAAVGGGTSEASVITSQEPIDVRYSVERINNVDYVTADQFQAGMQQAAAQGAQRGEQRALRSLQQSTAVRSRVGMR